MKKRVLVYTIVFFAAVCLINFLVYKILTQKIEGADLNLESRGIETPIKLLLNGYLGLFFRFGMLGDINWIVLPAFAVFLVTLKPKFTREQKAMLTVLVFSFLLIALKGFFNSRYQYTLLPFTLFFLFLFTWKIYTYFGNPYYLREIVLVFLLGLVMQFTYYTLFGSRAQEHIDRIFGEHKVETSQEYKSVDDIHPYIDSLPTTSSFLVNNYPNFYYYTHKKGHYYWCLDDFLYTRKGIRKLFEKRDNAAVKTLLRDSLNCRYIYTVKSYNDFSDRFKTFLKEECTLLVQDRENTQLYQLNE